MESPERIWHLMARSLNNEASETESDELFELLADDYSLNQQFELLKRAWPEEQDSSEDEEEAKEHILKIINRAKTETGELAIAPRRRNRRRRLAFTGLALAILVITSGAWLFLNNASSPAPEKETLIAQKGSRTRSLLPDGSTVWLNAGSKLYFENNFTGKSREVRLEGEAFFDIVKRPSQPFIVHTSGIDIRVLGTAFNVKAYPEDVNVETTLYRGRVQVFRQEDELKTPIELKPNEKLILSKHAASYDVTLPDKNTTVQLKATPPSFTITSIDSTKKENERFETAWIYSRLEFRGDDFEQLALKMDRWFNIRIVFEDEKVKHLRFNGSFENETPEQALAGLKAAIRDFDYQINGNEISIRSSD